MNRWIAWTGAAALAVALAAPPAAAQSTEQFHWKGAVPAGRTVRVSGINGDVKALAASGSEVEVTATKRSKHGRASAMDVEVRKEGGGIRVCAVYPAKGGGTVNSCDGGHRDMEDGNSIDFTIRVPSGVAFRAGTVNGDVEARSLGGDVRASTVNGSVHVEGTGKVEASTVNGGIEAVTGAATWSDDLEFETVNGSITVTLPGNVNAEVRAETVNGGLESDFPLTISSGKMFGPRSIEGTIGQGGGTLKLSTVNGSIRLRKS